MTNRGQRAVSPGFLSKTFSLLPCAPPPPPRLLGSPPPLPPHRLPRARRWEGSEAGEAKGRNCLRAQSSKKASSIWRDRRPLPGPPSAAAAAAAPASRCGDPEPRLAGVSRGRTGARAPAPRPTLPGARQLLGSPGLSCCSRRGLPRVRRVPRVSPCRCARVRSAGAAPGRVATRVPLPEPQLSFPSRRLQPSLGTGFLEPMTNEVLSTFAPAEGSSKEIEDVAVLQGTVLSLECHLWPMGHWLGTLSHTMLRGTMAVHRGERLVDTLLWILLATAGCLADLVEVPQVTVQPASTVQKPGGTVILGCVVDPPWVNVTWRLNGKELNGSDNALGVLLSHGTLVIAALNNHTVGRYQCVARMPAGAVASVPATVTLANLQDFKLDVQHVIEVDEGNTAVIACHLPESHPKAQVRYSVKQEWLEASRDNYLIMPSGNLQIVNASQEDEGMYKCAAYNPVTQEVKTSGSSDRLRVRRSTAEAARIIYPLEAQTVIVTKGQSLILECVASGIPPPRVTWAKDGSSVTGYNKTRFLLSNLLIDTTSEDDSGTYRCMASNGVGAPGAAVILYNVQVFEPPVVTVELSQLVIPWGQNAKLTCEVRGNPPPSVLWLRNAVPLTASQRLRLSRRALRVVSVGPEDEGVYQCMAENEVGSAHAVVQLRTSRPDTMLKSWQDAGPLAATPPVPPSRPGSPDQILKEQPGLAKPPTSVQPASLKCLGEREQVAPAEAPVILSSPRTSKTDSYELVWRPRHEDGSRAPILYYVVKHRKVTNSSDDWTISGIPANQLRLTLTRLDPGSLYEVEMAAYNCAGEGQTAMVTFRTGRRPKPEIIASKEQPIQRDDPGANPQSSGQPDHSRLSPPEAPDRPTISMASETSVYVTWIPRGNGGFPIQSFRVEYKKLKKEGDWILATSAIPPSRLSVEITGLEKGTSYKFRVRALNMLGESEPSAPSRPYVVLDYSGRTYQRPVAGPYITFTDAVNETTIMLKWMYIPASNNNTPIHGFYIYYRPTDSDNDSDYKKDMVEGDRYWHSISHLQPETSYDIKMQCFNEGGESEFSNVMICETKARKTSSQPGRIPPPTLALPQPPPPETMERPVGTGAMVARASDLPYLIVGVVLGSIVLIIVTFIPFCLWRAWSKQKHTTDLGFPRSTLLSSSCQYTMVPLRGLPGHQANGQPYLGGINSRACASRLHGGRGCPVAAMGCPGAKAQQQCPRELLQRDNTYSPLRKTTVANGCDPQSRQVARGPTSSPDKGSCLYTLPDASTHQLLQPQDRCHLQEPPSTTCQAGPRRTPEGPGLTASWDPPFHTGPQCCLGLVPVEEMDSPASCQVVGGNWCPQHPTGTYTGQEPGIRLSPSPPAHASFETPPPTI